jgi:hypothetical protein
MKTAICDSRMPRSALSELENYCDRILLLPPFSALPEPVSAHPDMLIFPCVKEKIIFTHGEYASVSENLFKETGYGIITISERAGEKYPSDILLNAARIGNVLLGKLSHISSSVISYAEKERLTLVNTKQGYARCSVCSVSESAIITSDRSIARAVRAVGIDVLEVSQGGVDLSGYGCGFIGGASGTDSENVFFCGNVEAHPDGVMIKDFCLKHGKRAISLSSDRLYDVGTIFFI